MNREEFNSIVKDHALYLAGKGGKRADFSRKDLTGLSLVGEEWHEDLGFALGETTREEWDGNPFQGGVEFRLTRREAEADMW